MDRAGMELIAGAAGLPLRTLINAGYISRESLRAATDDELKENLGLDDAKVQALRGACDEPPVLQDMPQENAQEPAENAGTGNAG